MKMPPIDELIETYTANDCRAILLMYAPDLLTQFDAMRHDTEEEETNTARVLVRQARKRNQQ